MATVADATGSTAGQRACRDVFVSAFRICAVPMLVRTGAPWEERRAIRVIVRIMKHVVYPGVKYGNFTILAEVRKVAPSGRSYRAGLCRCDCGNELMAALRSLISGDARSCGCSRGRPKYEWKRCPVCGRLARIRRDRRSCSRTCGHKLIGATLQSGSPSYDVWHNRVRKARGPASGYRCVDCGDQAEDWSTADPSSDDIRVRFQPRCRNATVAMTAPSAREIPGPS